MDNTITSTTDDELYAILASDDTELVRDLEEAGALLGKRIADSKMREADSPLRRDAKPPY